MQQFPLSPIPLVVVARLPSCTWPPRKEGGNSPLEHPRLTECKVGWSPCPPFGPTLLLEEAATSSSGQPSAVGSGGRYKQGRSQTAPSLLVLFHSMRLPWEGSSEMPSPFLQLSCAGEALGPQPHLTQQLLCSHQYQVQPVQLPNSFLVILVQLQQLGYCQHAAPLLSLQGTAWDRQGWHLGRLAAVTSISLPKLLPDPVVKLLLHPVQPFQEHRAPALPGHRAPAALA